jgi:multiple sugar transport system substrate-binding protein
MRMSRVLLLVLAIAALLVAGCGEDDEEGKKTGDAKKAPTGDVKSAKGNVNWCIGKDTSGAYGAAIDDFKKENPNVKVKLVELPESADEQRTQLVQRQRAKSTECDVLGLDVIWTAEFAAQGWLQDVSDLVSKREGDFIPSTLETAKYENKTWAVPYHTNAGFLYYRTDQAGKSVPASWEEVYDKAKQEKGLVYQGARYEGLTVHFLELLYSAGGRALSDDGKTVEVDSEEGRKTLEFMVGGFKDGAVPKAVTTYQEEPARRAFEAGKATFMRNWPYAYALGNKSKVKGKFDIAPFPKFGGGEAASVLGGFNLAISAYSRNPEGAAAFINFASSPKHQTDAFGKSSTSPPAATAPYDDPTVKKKTPFASDLKKAVEQGQARPVSPVYPQISESIYKNVHDALQGKQQPGAALKKMRSEMEKALQTF